MDSDLKQHLAARIRQARSQRDWTLEQFAEASGVSRAMISKIERGEVSPTAAILARLAAGLGVSLASLFAPAEPTGAPLLRWEDQSDWEDPASGYVRRNVSPPGSAAEVVYVTFPAGARVLFDNSTRTDGLEQLVWVLEGEMEMTVGAATTRLEPGDCLRMGLDAPIHFHNPGAVMARYAVVLARR